MNGTILTTAGKAELLNAPLLQKKVNWTTIVVGDGNGTGYIPVEEQTELKNQVWSGSIIDIREIDSGHLEFHTVLPSEVGPFIIREAGILNDQGVLVAVCPVEDQNKVSLHNSSGTSNDMDFIIEVLVDNAEVINLTIDPTIVIATREYVEYYVNLMLGKFKDGLTELEEEEVEEIFEMAGSGIPDNWREVEELEQSEVEEMFDMTGGSSPGGYPEDWEEATTDDIDSLFD